MPERARRTDCCIRCSSNQAIAMVGSVSARPTVAYQQTESDTLVPWSINAIPLLLNTDSLPFTRGTRESF
jgi:hypothetical protein